MAAETVSVEEHFQSCINRIAAEQKFENFQTKITPISSGGANFTSNLFKIKITQDGKDDLELFAKVAALNESFRNQALFQPFENEYNFYNYLKKIYRQLEESHGVSDRLKLPEYYGAETTHGREIMVLEDLTSRGYGTADRFQSVDWSYAAAAVTELAKFHALSIVFKHENPHEFHKFIAPFSYGLIKKCEMADQSFLGVTSSALAAVREDNKETLEAFLKKYGEISYFNSLFKPSYCDVIIHTDFKPSNMMHKVLNDGTTDVIPVDYQTIQSSSPIIDLYYFIFIATDGAFRAKYFEKLIDHYYAELSSALLRLGLIVGDKYPRKDYENDLKEKLPYGLLVSVMILPALVLPEDEAMTMGEDFSSLAFKPTGELFATRLNEVVDDFVRWGLLENGN